MEGLTAVDDLPNAGVAVVKDVAGREPKHHDIVPREPSVSCVILGRIVAHIMGHPIDFDRKPRRLAIEVQYITTGGVLTAELEAVGAGTKDAPQKSLGERHIAAQCPGSLSAGF